MNNNSHYYLTGSYLNTELSSNVKSQSISSIGLKVLNPLTDNYGLSFGLGIKNVYSKNSINDKVFTAFPLGLFAKFEFNEAFYLNIDFNYAPRVLTYLDGDKYKDIKVKMSYKILSSGYIFIGARNIVTTYTNSGEVKFDNSAFVGYEVRF
jgi:hypothetical protein